MYPPDDELIKKAKNKDKQAFTVLFDKYKDRILGYLYKYVGDYQKAEDLVIETFLNVYNNLDSYKELGIFSSWLYKIATNCAKKELRKKERKFEVSMDDPIGDDEDSATLADLVADDRQRPDYSAREAELKEEIYGILMEMDEKYKEVLLLCDVEGLTYDEAAQVLNTNSVTVGTRLKRARSELAEVLKKRGFKI